MNKIYSVTVFDQWGALIVFSATLEKARLRARIHTLQGLRCTRPAYCPRMTAFIANQIARGQIVAPALR